MRVYNFTGKQQPGKNKTIQGLWKKVKKLTRNKKFGVLLFRTFAAGVLFVALLFLYYAKDLPDPNQLLTRNVPESTKIFAKDGSLLYEIHGEAKRTQITLDQITNDLKNATIAIEDKDFYKHHGISFTGIGRALLRVAVRLDTSGGGGSTITQQLVKNAIMRDKTVWDRKPREAILSIAMETRFSKEQILQMYLNEIPYGKNAYGVEAASQTYFGKSAKDLNLAESAYLASLPQSPSRYNPFGPNRSILDSRKDTVLTAMRQQGYITDEQEKQAKEAKVEFKTIKTAIAAPHFVFMVEDYLAQKFGEKTLQEGGLKVYTTLDPKLQEIAERVVREGAEKNSKSYNAHNAALVAVDPKTGQILAMVGSKDYFAEATPAGCKPGTTGKNSCVFEPNVNAAISSRQPGSSFKPYVYVTAFKKEFGYAPASMLVDVTTNFGRFGNEDYVPGNYNGSENGPLSMRKALAGSLNIPAVKTLALVGVNNAVQTARELGITSPMQDCGLSLVLGGCEVKLLDHVAAFGVLANGGSKHNKTPIIKIEDSSGKILEEYQSQPQQVLDPEAVYELVSIMTDNSARSYIFGANSPLILPGRVVAAKTGTTNKWHDGWTLGFTPSLSAGVWAGNNNGDFLKAGADGVFVAAPIWNAFMKEALKDTPAEEFPVPDGIERVLVDEVSGKLPTAYTPTTKTEVFASYSVPKEYDDVHIGVPTDSATGLPADSLTPPDRIIYQTYSVLHSEKRDNPNWENPVVAWALAHGYTYPSGSGVFTGNTNPGEGPSVSIAEPRDEATITTIPFKVVVSASSSRGIARIDLSIDGQFVRSINSAPYVFDISNTYSDGRHTIAVRAVDTSGVTSDTSTDINFSLNNSLNLIEPANQGILLLPTTLKAESRNLQSQVSFYYQTEKGNPQLIGEATNVSNTNNKYQYAIQWQNKPDSGTYFLFAKSNSGLSTAKLRVIIP